MRFRRSESQTSRPNKQSNTSEEGRAGSVHGSRQRWAEGPPGRGDLLRAPAPQNPRLSARHLQLPAPGTLLRDPAKLVRGRSQASAELRTERALLCNRRAILGPSPAERGRETPLTTALCTELTLAIHSYSHLEHMWLSYLPGHAFTQQTLTQHPPSPDPVWWGSSTQGVEKFPRSAPRVCPATAARNSRQCGQQKPAQRVPTSCKQEQTQNLN